MGCHIFHKSAKSISQEETDRDTSRIRCQSQNVERFVRAYHNAADICGLAVFHTNQDIVQFLIRQAAVIAHHAQKAVLADCLCMF